MVAPDRAQHGSNCNVMQKSKKHTNCVLLYPGLKTGWGYHHVPSSIDDDPPTTPSVQEDKLSAPCHYVLHHQA